MSFDQLRAYFETYLLNAVKVPATQLNTLVDELISTCEEQLENAEQSFLGSATTSTNPGTPTGRVWYLAEGPGTYTNFGGSVVTELFAMLIYNGSAWEVVEHEITVDLTDYQKSAPINQIIENGINSYINKGKNLFNKNIASTGYLVNGVVTTGGSYDNFKTSDLIKVTGSLVYSFSNVRVISYYDQNLDHISTETLGANQQYTITPNTQAGSTVSFIKYTLPIADINISQLEQNGSTTSFEAFSYNIGEKDSIPIGYEQLDNYKTKQEYLLNNYDYYNDSAYWVATDGNDSNDGSFENPWLTLNGAVTAASEGSVIYVKAGTYDEAGGTASWYISKGITFKAIGEVIVTSSGTTRVLYINTANPVTIDGFILDGEVNTRYCVDFVTSIANKTLINCTFKNAFYSGGQTKIITGAVSGSGLLVENCNFESTTLTSCYGIHFAGGFTLKNCNFDNFHGSVLALASGTNPVTIDGCYGDLTLGVTTNTLLSNTLTAALFTVKNCNFNILTAFNSIVGGRYLLIDNCSFTCRVATNSYPVYMTGPDDNTGIEIKDSIFRFLHKNQTYDIINIDGIQSPHVHGCTIETLTPNMVSHIEITGGLVTTDAGSALVENNKFYHRGRGGYICRIGTDSSDSGDEKLNGSKILNNLVFGARYYEPSIPHDITHGLMIGGQNDGLIAYNTCVGVGYAIVMKGWDLMENTADPTGIIYNCVINSNRAISVKGILGVNVFNNSIHVNLDTETLGIALSNQLTFGAANCTVKNNVLTFKDIRNEDYTLVHVLDAASAVGFVCDYNLLFLNNCTGGNLAHINGTDYADHASFKGAGYETNGENADPEFEYISENKLKLSATSPALQAATNLGANYDDAMDWTYDRDEEEFKSVVQSGTWDMGAFPE